MNNRTLYRIPEEGVIKGVCAGLADYLGVPAALVRVIALLAVLCGLFVLPVALYAALAWGFWKVWHAPGCKPEYRQPLKRMAIACAVFALACEYSLFGGGLSL